MVFSMDAAKRQKFYIQQGVQKPQWASVHQYVSHMEVLNGYLKQLPILKNSPKAVVTTKKGNIPFGESDLVVILLASVPIMWQNQYNLMHSPVPEVPRTLLLDLENIEHIMLKKYNKKLKAKVLKATTASSDGKGKPKKGTSGGGSSDQVPNKACAKKFCQHCKTHGSLLQMHNMSDCYCYNKEGKSLGATTSKPSDGKKPYKKFGGDKSIASMMTILKAIQKDQKRAGKSYQ